VIYAFLIFSGGMRILRIKWWFGAEQTIIFGLTSSRPLWKQDKTTWNFNQFIQNAWSAN